MRDTASYSSEIEIALAAVREAGRLCREVQARIEPGTLEKADRSPVTVADYGSQALVCRALGDAFPDDPIIAEEDSASLRDPENAAILDGVVAHVRAAGPDPDADAGTVCRWIDRGNATDYSDRFWTLDPIDGTKGFLRGGQYAVALALVVGGRVRAAALCCPNLEGTPGGSTGEGTVFTAVDGAGTLQYPMPDGAAPRPVRVSPETDTTRIRFCESVEAAHSSHDDAARIAGALGITAPGVRLDSQAKYAVVARGEADAYLRLPRTAAYVEKIWDHAAGSLVITEAGGRVSDIHGRDLDFGHGHLLSGNSGVIVSNGRLHDTILDTIRSLGIGA